MSHLQRLAINQDGFVFDPTTGESFTVNGTGLVILEGMMVGRATEDIVEDLIDRFEVTPAEVQRDLLDFNDRLRIFRLT